MNRSSLQSELTTPSPGISSKRAGERPFDTNLPRASSQEEVARSRWYLVDRAERSSIMKLFP
jgi:hypothetical protein